MIRLKKNQDASIKKEILLHKRAGIGILQVTKFLLICHR